MSTTNGSGKGSVRENGEAFGRPRGSRPAKEPRRRKGIVAEEAHLRARIDLARALGDPSEERVASQALVATLVARDVELEIAVDLALRSLAARDEPTLRHQLAGLLEGLGEPGLAASELRKLAAGQTGSAAAAILLRIGVLHARGGDPVGAQEAFLEASEADTADALPLELLGAVTAWTTATQETAEAALDGFSGRREGAEAYVRAARRRAAARDTEGELEDLLRAFELDPSSPLAAAALMSAYKVRERDDAVDQVLRSHANALAARDPVDGGEPTAADIHARRRGTALEAGQLGQALAAALDERLDGVFEGPGADVFDDLLARAAAYEPLAVRLELRADRESGKHASVRWAELGRLLSGPLAAGGRAAPALARAVAADASNTESIHALRALSQKSGDTSWLIEGLVRAVMGGAADGASEDRASRLAAAHELASFAEDRNDSILAAWAYRVMSELDPSDARARAATVRLEGPIERHEKALSSALETLESASPDDRGPLLVEIVRIARSLPGASSVYAKALLELASSRVRGADSDVGVLSSEVDPIVVEALRVAERVGDLDGVARLARAQLDCVGPNVFVRGVLVRALRRAHDPKGASEAARPFAEESATQWTCSVAWITAAAAGDESTRGRALASFAPACGPKIAPSIATVAAEVLADVGESSAARRTAEQACRAGGPNVRAVFVLARVATTEGRLAPSAAVHVMENAVPSSSWCARLAELSEQAGDLRGALVWARRHVALRPGDPLAARSLVARAMSAGDAEALADALVWLTPQPHPSKEMADLLAPAIVALSAMDAPRAAVIARRMLGVLGPRHLPLRRAIEHVGNAAKDAALRSMLGERWIAAGASVVERGALLLELASSARERGDVDAELRAYARAAREGIDLSSLAARMDDLFLVPRTPDGDLAYLEVVAEVRRCQGRVDGAADAFRDLGAALWDMADDRPRAVQAWLQSALLDSVHGYDTLRRDLASFADTQYAVDCLSELTSRETDRVRSGVIATQAARAALDAGAPTRALGLAKIALERDPAHADALETAELACAKLARVPEMSPLYDQVARRARGRFGRRAAHHRAARFFEAGGSVMMALKHAAQAFIAVPAEGTTLALLQRTAINARRESIAVRTVEHVAELSRSPHARVAWLLRAASMTVDDLDGARQRMDLLLKATVAVPSPATLDMLATSAREIVAMAPDDTAAIALRLERAGDQLAKRLEGPDGARIAITFVDMAIGLFADGPWGWRLLERAIAADADVDEYARLVRHAPSLGRSNGASDAVLRVKGEIDKPYSNVGHALLVLVGAIAKELGDPETRAMVLVRAAEKESDDDAIVALADEAVNAHGKRELVDRLSKKVGAVRLALAIRNTARIAMDQGRAGDAVRMLERAVEVASPEQQSDLARDLGEALTAAGRGEDAVLRELARPDMAAEGRAVRWAEIARMRQEHGDSSGVVDALFRAAMEESTRERWSAVERAAEAAGRDQVQIDALEHLVALADVGARADERRSFLKRIARLEADRGSDAAAEKAWRGVWALDPSDADADVAIEAMLVARGSFDDLAVHLAERATRLSKSTSVEDKEKLRAVRLRRAAILEQRLARIEDACLELERVLSDHPGHPSALRWLADLYERASEPAKALPALEALLAATNEEIEYVTLGVRRVRALLAAGDLDTAQKAVKDLSLRAPAAIAVAEVRVAVFRATRDATRLGNALADLARLSVEEPRVRSEMLVEAAQSAARAGDADTSLARAREAARLLPNSASTQLFARGLEYRLRGVGSKDDALATIATLDRLSSLDVAAVLEPEDRALRAFLLAEAEDAVHGPGSGEPTLRRCLAEVGPQPLIALGIAERASRAGRHEEACRFYTDAVYGNLLGLRPAGRVAMAAAESASLANDRPSMQRFLEAAAKDPETRGDAHRRLSSLALAQDDVTPDAGPDAGPVDVTSPSEQDEPIASVRHLPLGSKWPPTVDAPSEENRASNDAPPASTHVSEVPTSPAGKVARARARLLAGARQEAEKLFTEALRDGSIDAADGLDELLREDPARRSVLVKVRRQAVELRPGNAPRLIALRDAAKADQNTNYVRAIEHVLSAFAAGTSSLTPPPLTAQSTQPGLLTLLTRHSHEAAGEAFGVVWEGAKAVFAKAPSAVFVPGLERVVPGPASALARVYEALLRLLDTPRFALFHKSSETLGKSRNGELSFEEEGSPLSVSVALLPTPAAIVAGDCREDSADLRWALGDALSSILPQNALVRGLGGVDARALWNVLLGAFGPPGLVTVDRKDADLAEILWQTLAPRTQRRLKELLAVEEATPFDLVLERAKQSSRRVGMFLTGDFAHAARKTIADFPQADSAELERPGGLERLASELPSLADLFRLAIRPEYADARWHLPTPAAQRLASGRLPPV